MAERNGSAKGNDPGGAGDALSAFAQAALKWSAQAATDPDVVTMVAMGWSLSEAQTWAQTAIDPSDQLLEEVPADLRWSGLIKQVTVLCARLETRPRKEGLDSADIKARSRPACTARDGCGAPSWSARSPPPTSCA